MKNIKSVRMRELLMKIKKSLKKIVLVVCSLIVIIMTLSVPSKERYNIWLAEEYGIVATKDANITGIYTKDSMELFEMRHGVKGFGIFTIRTQVFQYENEIFQIKTIGAFNNCFVIESDFESIKF